MSTTFNKKNNYIRSNDKLRGTLKLCVWVKDRVQGHIQSQISVEVINVIICKEYKMI